MPSDLHDDLTAVAPTPSRSLDTSAVWKRGLRLRRRRQVLLGAASVATAAVAVVAALAVPRFDKGGEPRPAVGPSHTSEDADEHLLELRDELRSQLYELRQRESQLLEVRRSLMAQLSELEAQVDDERGRVLEEKVDAFDDRLGELTDEIDQMERRLALLNARLISQRRFTPTPESSRCGFPRVLPTYLPWASVGQIPPPRRSYDAEIDRAQLVWVNPDDVGESVGLTVYPFDGAGPPEEPIGVRVEGSEGYLHDGSPGEHSAWWDLDARCNFLELSLSLTGTRPVAIDRELIKIARSLR